MRRVIILFVCIAILCGNTFVFAHPGRTDENGGHMDYDTGEYHYHHGYSAHNHYDMDEDGVIDCPYDFDDQTGKNSGSSGNNTSGDSWGTRKEPGIINWNELLESATTTTAPVNTQEEAKTVPVWVYWIIGFLATSTVWLFLSNKRKGEEYSILENRYCDDLDALKEKHAKDLELLQCNFAKELDERISQNARFCATPYVTRIDNLDRKVTLLQGQLNDAQSKVEQEKTKTEALKSRNLELLSQILELRRELSADEAKMNHQRLRQSVPEDVYFVNGSVPVKGIISEYRPFGDYTVYISKRGKCYHADRYCGSGLLDAAHLFDVTNKKSPCQKCVFGQNVTVPEWYGQLDFLSTDPK